MIILLDLDITVHLVKSRLNVFVISIIEPIMTNIVTHGGNQKRKYINFIELCVLYHILTFQYVVTVLSNIRTMEVIVIRNLSFVPVVYLGDELCELMQVDACQ